MVFNNKKELEAFILKKCRSALLKTQEEIYKIVKDFLRQFYADYDPVLYERTYQLLQSLVMSRIVSDGKGYKAEVYFNFNGLGYDTGSQPSGRQVIDAAAHGGHGAEGLKVVDGGVGVWDAPIEILDAKAVEMLRNMLISEGIPIE